MKKATIVLITLVLFCLPACKKTTEPLETKDDPPPAEKVITPDTDAEKAAVEAAKTWLQLVDDGKFDESWTQAAEFFKNAIKQETWTQQTKVFRTPLGKCTDRKFKESTYTTTAPGAPDGEYVIIQFDSSFENKAAAVETITPMKEKDGTWKVSGYFIR